MKKPKILLVAGARPNFMKIAPIIRAIRKDKTFKPVLVHTGQHYDHSMSDSFFRDLGIPTPDYNLEVGSASHAEQTANIMMRFEKVCLKETPEFVLVVGDVNSTIAAGLVAKKLDIKLVHVEAGLRSRDRKMPEEINRLATDAITDVFFTTEPEGSENLIREGQSPGRVHFVGHVMIDNLKFQLGKFDNKSTPHSGRHIQKSPSPRARQIQKNPPSAISFLKERLPAKYVCLTLHRPSNVDNKDTLTGIINALKKISEKAPIVFPCHPRTLKNLKTFKLDVTLKRLDFQNLRLKNTQSRGGVTAQSNQTESGNRPVSEIPPLDNGIYLLEPLGYNEFLSLWKDCALLLTDSGGLQEETTALKIPCITIRENTERPITISRGSNELAGTSERKIISLAQKALAGKWKASQIPKFWDGKASERIVKILKER